jgi:hypothetical protein
MIDVENSHTTLLTVTQRDSTTELSPLPTGNTLVVTATGGLPGPEGDQGPKGDPGEDGAAQIPEILDGGNF